MSRSSLASARPGAEAVAPAPQENDRLLVESLGDLPHCQELFSHLPETAGRTRNPPQGPLMCVARPERRR